MAESLPNFPQRVRDLDGLDIHVRCPRCGRVAPIDVARMRIDQRMRLPEFLAKLQCNETNDHRRCGGKPDQLVLRYQSPPDRSGIHPAPHTFVMDMTGAWTEPGVE